MERARAKQRSEESALVTSGDNWQIAAMEIKLPYSLSRGSWTARRQHDYLDHRLLFRALDTAWLASLGQYWRLRLWQLDGQLHYRWGGIPFKLRKSTHDRGKDSGLVRFEAIIDVARLPFWLLPFDAPFNLLPLSRMHSPVDIQGSIMPWGRFKAAPGYSSMQGSWKNILITW